MKKKNINKKIQAERPTSLGRLIYMPNASHTSKHENRENHSEPEEPSVRQEEGSTERKRDKKTRKAQEEITNQIQEENVQHQEQTGENQ